MTTKIFAIIALSVSLLLCSSCSSSPRKNPAKPPAAKITSVTGAKIEQSGNAEIPVHVDEIKSRAAVVIPKGSTVVSVSATESEPARAVLTFAADSVLESFSDSSKVTGPKSYAPERAPSPSAVALGNGVTLFYWIGGGFALLMFGMLYLQHYKAAGVAALGAVGMPMLAQFLSSGLALAIGLAILCVSLSLYAAWHFMHRKGLIPHELPRN